MCASVPIGADAKDEQVEESEKRKHDEVEIDATGGAEEAVLPLRILQKGRVWKNEKH